MAVDKKVWIRIVRGMEHAGYRKAVQIHRDIGSRTQKKITDRLKSIFPKDRYKWKWYTDYNGNLALFIKEHEQETSAKLEHKQTNRGYNASTYLDRISERLHRQAEKGLEKYGMLLEDNQGLGFDERIEHLAEELTDGLQYIEHLKELMNKHNQALISAISELIILSSRSNIPGGEIKRIAQSLNNSLKELHGNAHK